MLRLLHTSDWHLGHNLFHQDRRREHALFLDWLLDALREWQVDTLVVAGDIFDTVAPPNYALALYYDFLRRLTETPCRQAVIIGGNHDSAASLHAPRQLLKQFNIHVIGAADREDPRQDLIVLRDRQHAPCGVVAAVPFLRERDVRRAEAGESHGDKAEAYIQGQGEHYARARELGRARIAELCGDGHALPLIATGHLMAAGGEISESEREVTVGTLGGIPARLISQGFDYLALGHLHKAQTVKGACPVRYSGSPLPLSFAESRGGKEVTLVTFAKGEMAPVILPMAVPEFQALATVRGDWQQVETFMRDLPTSGPALWLEIQLEMEVWGTGVQERVEELARGRAVEVLAVRNGQRLTPRLAEGDDPQEVLTALTPMEVFSRRLAQEPGLSAEELSELLPLYQQAVDAARRALEGGQDAD
jgi:exonuclease SbcD